LEKQKLKLEDEKIRLAMTGTKRETLLNSHSELNTGVAANGADDPEVNKTKEENKSDEEELIATEFAEKKRLEDEAAEIALALET